MRPLLLVLLSLFTVPCLAQYKVSLSWDAPACVAEGNCQDPPVGYNIFKSANSGGSWTQVNSSEIVGLTFIDPNVNYATTYEYYATSVDSSGNQSSPSNTSTISIPSLMLNPVGGVQIILTASFDGSATRMRIEYPNACAEPTYDRLLSNGVGI